MIRNERHRSFTKLFGSAIIMQGVLSATNLLIALILIRRTNDHQYGYFVLTQNAIMLVTGLQQTFIQPQMVVRMTGRSEQEKSDLVGGLYRDQRRIWPIIGMTGLLLTLGMWLGGVWTGERAIVALAAACSVLAYMFREFFRMVLLAYRRPLEVLRADLAFAAALILGVFAATLSAAPATAAVIALGLAAVIGGVLSRQALRRIAPYNTRGMPGILRQIAPLGIWTATGSFIYWVFSQGYNFLVAGTLDVPAVSALNVTQKIIMPINLLSTGICSMMLPTASGWLESRHARVVFARLALIAGGLSLIAVCYFGVLWLARDWVFSNILKKTIAQRDLLLLLWYAIGILMLFRDQLLYLPLARARFRILTGLTSVSAAISLSVSYIAMHRLGVSGALWGVLAGELTSVCGLIVLSEIECRRTVPVAMADPPAVGPFSVPP